MSILDACLLETKAYVEAMKRAGWSVRRMSCPLTADSLTSDLPIMLGGQQDLILKRDTAVELGEPEKGSCAYSLWTSDSALVSNGLITLIGSDINESVGKSLPFGQVMIFGGRTLTAHNSESLFTSRLMASEIEGYMLKSTPQYHWSRVSKAAAEKGFSFEMLGRALMALCRRKYPNIESMEILFVTAGSTELRPLEVIAQKSRALWYRATEEEPGRDKALDSCHGIGCAVCDSKMICDGIRTFLQRENE